MALTLEKNNSEEEDSSYHTVVVFNNPYDALNFINENLDNIVKNKMKVKIVIDPIKD